jgi:gluconate 2-dehydrogenase gamma chain
MERGMRQHSLNRRALLFCGTALLTGLPAERSRADMAWTPGPGSPPIVVRPGPWQFFTPEEAATIEALVERLIPADEFSISGKEAGCAVFIDRQLAGFYGSSERLYTKPPFMAGTPMQGYQGAATPAAQYRQGLAALHAWCAAAYLGRRPFHLTAEQRDTMLKGLESGQLKLDGADGRGFFELLLANTMEGFFADPLYGGNQGFAGWKMLGFPGARYDFRDHVGKHNERFPLPPVGITGRSDWNRPT